MKKLSLLFGEHVPKFEAALIEFNPVFPTLIILKTSLPKGQLELIQLPKLVIKTSNSWWHYLICRIFSAPLSLNTQKNSEKKKNKKKTQKHVFQVHALPVRYISCLLCGILLSFKVSRNLWGKTYDYVNS